jgi:hypothetical protein
MEYRTLRGIHFIRVRGDAVERAKAHAALLREQVNQGALLALAKKNEWLIRRGPGLLRFKPVQEIAVQFYKKLLLPILDTNCSREERMLLQTAAKETGLSYELFRETLFQADAMMLLARTSMMKHFLPEWIPSAFPGCTSAVALKDWTQAGKILACRNFDYVIVGPWEKYPTVVFSEPTEAGEIPFTSVTTAGVHPAGVTSMNREGLTLTTHAHFGKKVSLQGKSIVMIGDEVIRSCRTLGQAVDLIKKRSRCANWAFVMSSAKENDAAVIEMTPDKIHVRNTEDGFISHTNYFHGEEFRKDEALLSGAYCEDLQARISQIRSLLEPNRGRLEPAHMSVALGDHQDPLTSQERVFGNTLSVVTTVKSVIFEPDSQRFWMGAREESPVCLGDYIEVNVDRFWKVPLETYEETMSILPHYQPKNPNLIEAVHHYRDAYKAYHMDNHEPDFTEKTLTAVAKALAAYPEDGHLWVQAGLVAFKCHQFKDAKTYFEGSQSRVLSDHVNFVRDLYLARCFDLLGFRKKAIQLYKKGVSVPEPKLQKAFKSGVKSKFKKSLISKIMIDLQFPDTFHYH